MSQEQCTIRVAISGGGLAGASLFHVLMKILNLDVHIFESAPEFKEAGAAVGITKNAHRALELMGSSAVQCLERAGAVPQKGIQLILAQGPDEGETVVRVGGEENVVSIVHRAAFLRELLADAPSEKLHASKKLKDIEQKSEDGPLILHFEDGTTHECDVLIGADGIHSRVRKFILGDSEPAASPVPAGWWMVQALKPYEEAVAILGDEYLDLKSPREVAWIGDGTIVFHNILSEGKLVQLVLAAATESKVVPENWTRFVESGEIRDAYSDWPPKILQSVEELFCTQPQHLALYLWEHLPARTYVKGTVGMIGDAAHSTTPWQGSGAGMSVEDSLVLSSLLERAKSPSDARVALQVYDSTRRARTQRVVESSNGIGKMVTNRDPETGLDAAKLKEKLRHRWDFILDFDVSEHRDQAMRQMEEELKAR